MDSRSPDDSPQRERTADDFAKMTFDELVAETNEVVYGILPQETRPPASPKRSNPWVLRCGVAAAIAAVGFVLLSLASWPEASWWSVVRPIGIILCFAVALGGGLAAGLLSAGDAPRASAGSPLRPVPAEESAAARYRLRSPAEAARASIPHSWRDAEHSAAAWLRGRGETNVVVGKGTGDGGVDVETSRYVVQVKDWQGNVGGPAIRQIAGVAAARGKRGMVIARTGFTADALAFARQAGVELVISKGGYRRAD